MGRESGPSEEFADRWDAGELGCGELVIVLRRRVAAIPVGADFELIARDLGAPEDLPSWCRLTGHRLVHAEHPRYVIRRQER